MRDRESRGRGDEVQSGRIMELVIFLHLFGVRLGILVMGYIYLVEFAKSQTTISVNKWLLVVELSKDGRKRKVAILADSKVHLIHLPQSQRGRLGFHTTLLSPRVEYGLCT